jgi:hypothetical protein
MKHQPCTSFNYDNNNEDSNHGATPTPQLDSDNNNNDDNEGQGSRWCTDDNEEGSRRRVLHHLGSR